MNVRLGIKKQQKKFFPLKAFWLFFKVLSLLYHGLDLFLSTTNLTKFEGFAETPIAFSPRIPVLGISVVALGSREVILGFLSKITCK